VNDIAQSYRVILLLAEAPLVKLDALLATVRKLAPSAEGAELPDRLQLALSNDAGRRFTLDISTPTGEPAEQIELARSQTWDWPEADHAVQHAHACLSVIDTCVAADNRAERLFRLNVVLRALLEHTRAVALLWEPAQRLVQPEAFIESLAHGGTVVDHAVNVRLFRIPDGRPGQLLMDTLGLAPFGLPDLQCHFAGADPARMGALLAGYAEYVFAKGDVLNEDSLIRGIESHEEWSCARDDSMALPNREVVDIRPDKLWVPH